MAPLAIEEDGGGGAQARELEEGERVNTLDKNITVPLLLAFSMVS